MTKLSQLFKKKEQHEKAIVVTEDVIGTWLIRSSMKPFSSNLTNADALVLKKIVFDDPDMRIHFNGEKTSFKKRLGNIDISGSDWDKIPEHTSDSKLTDDKYYIEIFKLKFKKRNKVTGLATHEINDYHVIKLVFTGHKPVVEIGCKLITLAIRYNDVHVKTIEREQTFVNVNGLPIEELLLQYKYLPNASRLLELFQKDCIYECSCVDVKAPSYAQGGK